MAGEKVFLKNLKKLRLQRGLSQAEMGRAIHVTPQTVYTYEAGKVTPSLPTLLLLADFFQVSTDYLRGRTAFQYPVPDLGDHLVADDDEAALLKLYHAMPAATKRKAQAILRELHGS